MEPQKIWNQLVKEAQSGSLAPAYLFYGPGESGKKMACEFVQYLFCVQKKENSPCGECASCLPVIHHQHPDFYLIESEGKSISIDLLRGLKKNLAKTTLSAPLKAVVIHQASEMTVSAANSLLKTLEEPPGSALFILIAPQLFQILPTIRSRCRKIFFSSTVDHEPSTEMSGALDQWTQLQGTRQTFRQISTLSAEWASAGFDLILFLEMIKRKFLGEIKEKQAWQQIDQLDRLSEAQRDLDRNVNKTLVLENLMLDIL